MAENNIDAADGETGEGYFASVSDLMVGILFVFLLMLTVFALNFREAEQEQMVQLEAYRRLEEQARQDQEAARQAQEEARRAEQESQRAQQAALRAELEAQRAEQEAQRAKQEAQRAKQEAERLEANNRALQAALNAAVARLELELREREQARADMLTRLAEGLVSSGVRFQIDHQSGVLRLPEDVLFSTGSSDLTERSRRTVETLAGVLSRILPCFAHASDQSSCSPTDSAILETVLVEGHTDRRPFQGYSPQQSEQRNDQLATARALTVFSELRRAQPSLDLLKNSGDLPLLGVSGYGPRRPLPEALGTSEGDYAQNRRIDIRFVLSSRTSDEIRRLIEEINELRRQQR